MAEFVPDHPAYALELLDSILEDVGATRGSVMVGVLRRVLLLTVIGVAAGLALTFAAKQWIASMLTLHLTHQAALLALLSIALILGDCSRPSSPPVARPRSSPCRRSEWSRD